MSKYLKTSNRQLILFTADNWPEPPTTFEGEVVHSATCSYTKRRFERQRLREAGLSKDFTAKSKTEEESKQLPNNTMNNFANLRKLLGCLPDIHRQAFQLWLMGDSEAEIAKQLELPEEEIEGVLEQVKMLLPVLCDYFELNVRPDENELQETKSEKEPIDLDQLIQFLKTPHSDTNTAETEFFLMQDPIYPDLIAGLQRLYRQKGDWSATREELDAAEDRFWKKWEHDHFDDSPDASEE